MATDGVRILDSDISHDTYSTIIGLFESGLDRDAVLQQYPFKQHDYGPETDYYHELFVTAYALAFWELGWLDDEIQQEAKRVISKGASVFSWTEEYGTSAGKKRQAELSKFQLKISSENKNLRKRRLYKQTETAIFETGDLVTYQKENGIYRVLLCVNTSTERGKIWYTFTPTSYYSETFPTLDKIENAGLYGVRIAVSGDSDSVSKSQEGVAELWKIFPQVSSHLSPNSPFIIGLVQDFIQHKAIRSFKDKFNRIGALRIKEQFNKQGSGSFSDNFEQFDKTKEYYQALKYFEFPVKILCVT
jgi:hypothetical protein